MSKPVSPQEIAALQVKIIPAEVFDVVNAELAVKFNGRSATIMQKDIDAKIAEKMGITVDEVYKRKYLDFEPAYREAEWKVVYDKPGYNESYEPSFTFTFATK